MMCDFADMHIRTHARRHAHARTCAHVYVLLTRDQELQCRLGFSTMVTHTVLLPMM